VRSWPLLNDYTTCRRNWALWTEPGRLTMYGRIIVLAPYSTAR
jgi:hypothetical protein